MASQYFTNEKAQANPYLKTLGLALKGATYSDENIGIALFFLQSLENYGGRTAVLKEYVGHFDKKLNAKNSLDFFGLIKMIGYIKYLIHDSYHLDQELFGFEPYGIDAEKSVFGLGEETSSNNLNKHIQDAILLISLLQEARLTDFREISTETPAKKEEDLTTPPPQSQTEDVVTAGAPFMGGGSTSKKQTEEEKKKEDEKKKKEEEEEKVKKKPESEKFSGDLRAMAEADRKMRHEILRIRSALTYQLASIYGIPESQFASFEQEIAQHVTPIVYTHLHKLSGDELAQALSSNRTNLYLQSLSSLQRNSRFQHILVAATQAAHKNATGKVLTKDDVEKRASTITLGQAAQNTEQQFHKVLEKEVKEKTREAGVPLTSEEVTQIAQHHGVSADRVEGLLRNFFEDQRSQGKILISETELNSFFIRLQSYGISKRYSSAISDTDVEKFYEAFTQSFGPDSSKILQVFQQAAGFDGNSEKLLFANLLLGYSDRVALSAYHNSNIGGGETNLAALYTTPQKLPPNLQKENDKNLEEHIFHYGRDAVAHAFYTPANQFHALLGTLQPGTKKHNDIKNTISFHEISTSRSRTRMANMREKTVYYILSSVFGFQDVQQSIHFGDYQHISIFQESPSYLLALAPDQLALDVEAPFSEPSSAQIEAQKYADQEKGLLMAKALGFVFLGPESIEIIDKAWQIATTVRSVVKQLPGGEHLAKLLDFVVFDKFEQMGKFVDFMMKALALAALAFGALIAGALAILPTLISALHLSSVLQNGLAGLSRGLQAGAKAISSGVQSGVQGLSNTGQALFTKLNSALGAPISATSIMYATGGIIGTSFLMQTVLFSAFLTPRTGGASSGILDGIRRTQPPDIGCLKLITQQAEVLELSRLTGEAGEPFPEDQIDQIKIAAGQVFASSTYKNNFCKGGTVNVLYTPNKGGAAEVYGNTIVMRMRGENGGGKWSQGIVTYSLVHEMGHVLDTRNNFSQRMAASIPITSCFPTYPLPKYCESRLASESFAEATAIYISPNCYPGAGTGTDTMPKACATINFQRDLPQMYQWIKQNVFNGEL